MLLRTRSERNCSGLFLAQRSRKYSSVGTRAPSSAWTISIRLLDSACSDNANNFRKAPTDRSWAVSTAVFKSNIKSGKCFMLGSPGTECGLFKFPRFLGTFIVAEILL